MMNRRTLLIASAATAASACTTMGGASREGPGRSAWAHSTPDAHGLSLSAIETAAATLAAPGERQGLVVIRHGELVYEKYWANAWAKAEPTWKNVSFSSGKSWGSTMVGRAVTLGRIGVDDLVTKYQPTDVTGFRPQTTIKHLLTMSTGGTNVRKPSSVPPKKLADTSPPGPPAEYKKYDTPETANSPPGYGVSMQPGTQYYYDGVPADHLADITSIAMGKSSHRFMVEDIAGALGCEAFKYQPEGVDHNDNVRIGGSIMLSCRDMARLGQLYLNKGRWAGQQFVAESYIRDAVTPTQLNPAYGYLWWLNTNARAKEAPRSMFYASGARGQFGFVLPEQDMIIATMGYGEKQLSIEDAWKALGPILPTA